jgi:hypothetical protein
MHQLPPSAGVSASAVSRGSQRKRTVGRMGRNARAPAKCTASNADLLLLGARPISRKRRATRTAAARSFTRRRCSIGRIKRNIRASFAKRTAGSVGLAVERRAPHQEAEAPRYVHGGGQVAQHQTDRRVSNQEAKTPRYANARGEIIQHPAGCPARLFCGCGASIEAFGRSIRDLWAVASWYRFPRAAPAAGMAVLWGTRHVAIIRQYYGDGTATLYDANSGNGLTRVHRIRIAGLAVVDPHPGQTSPTPNSLMVIL